MKKRKLKKQYSREIKEFKKEKDELNNTVIEWKITLNQKGQIITKLLNEIDRLKI